METMASTLTQPCNNMVKFMSVLRKIASAVAAQARRCRHRPAEAGHAGEFAKLRLETHRNSKVAHAARPTKRGDTEKCSVMCRDSFRLAFASAGVLHVLLCIGKQK